jgi:hypothetical protein
MSKVHASSASLVFSGSVETSNNVTQVVDTCLANLTLGQLGKEFCFPQLAQYQVQVLQMRVPGRAVD